MQDLCTINVASYSVSGNPLLFVCFLSLCISILQQREKSLVFLFFFMTLLTSSRFSYVVLTCNIPTLLFLLYAIYLLLLGNEYSLFFSCLQTIIKAEPSKCVMKLQLILIGHQMWPRWERRTAYVYKDLGQAL